MINPKEYFREADDFLDADFITKAFEKYHILFKKLQKMYGINSDIHKGIFRQKERELISMANKMLKAVIEDIDVNSPMKIFEKLETFHDVNSVYRNPETLVEILNHLACCHRRLSSTDVAIEILNRALNICKSSEVNSGVTFTNLSAVFSQKKLIKKAIQMSQRAITELYPFVITNKTDQNVKLLAIAYFNLGTQLDMTGDKDQAIQNFERGIQILRKEDFPETEPVLRSLEQQLQKTKEERKKDMIIKAASPKVSRPASALIRPGSSHSRATNNFLNKSKTSQQRSNSIRSEMNQKPSQLNEERIGYSLKRPQVPYFQATTKNVNIPLTAFSQMPWVKSNEYTSSHDRQNPSRIYLEKELKPKKLQTYKIQNVGKPIYLDNASRNQSRLTTDTQKSGRAIQGEQYGDRFYMPRDQREQEDPNKLRVPRPVSRGNFTNNYGTDEEAELLNDSWQELVSDEDEETPRKIDVPLNLLSSNMSTEQMVKINRQKFYDSLKQHDQSLKEFAPSSNKFSQKQDLQDWSYTPNAESNLHANLNRPGTSAGFRLGSSSGIPNPRTLDQDTMNKKRDLEERRKQLKSPKVNYTTNPDFIQSNTGFNQSNRAESEDITGSLIVQNQELKRQNEDLVRQLEEEKSRNRIRELQEEREKFMHERDRSARLIQREWSSNAQKRCEKKLQDKLKKHGFRLERKIWREIPKENGGFSSCKIMVFSNKTSSQIAVLASNIRTNDIKDLTISDPISKGIKLKTVEKNLIISKGGKLEIKDISIHEASHSRHNTEEPLFDYDQDQEEGIYHNPEESPLFPTERSLSGKEAKLHEQNDLAEDLEEEPLFADDDTQSEEGKRQKNKALEDFARKQHQSAALIQDYLHHGAKARQTCKKIKLKKFFTQHGSKYMVQIRDSTSHSGGKTAVCFGISKKAMYPKVKISPYLVQKIAKKSPKSTEEAIFDQLEINENIFRLKDQSPQSEPVEIDMFDNADEINNLDFAGGDDLLIEESLLDANSKEDNNIPSEVESLGGGKEKKIQSAKKKFKSDHTGELSMQDKKLDESEAAVDSVHGSNSKRLSQMSQENDATLSEKTDKELRLDLEPFNVSNLRDKKGGLLQVVFRKSPEKVYIEVHEPNSDKNDARGILSSRVLKVSDLEQMLQKDKVQIKVVNAAMRSLCVTSNVNYSLAELEKHLSSSTFDELLQSQLIQ